MNSVTIGLKTGHSVNVDGRLEDVARRYEAAGETELLVFTASDLSTHPYVRIRRDSVEYIAEGGAL